MEMQRLGEEELKLRESHETSFVWHKAELDASFMNKVQRCELPEGKGRGGKSGEKVRTFSKGEGEDLQQGKSLQKTK
ncbi:unnamed protein product [Prunus armeniaca]